MALLLDRGRAGVRRARQSRPSHPADQHVLRDRDAVTARVLRARPGEAPIGLAFFIWLGLVSVFLIAQFWSYANDLYTEEQGKRLFAIIAIGGSLGAISGRSIAKLGDTFTLMPIAAAILVACVVLFNVIERDRHDEAIEHRTTDHGPGGFALVLRDRYLMLIGSGARPRPRQHDGRVRPVECRARVCVVPCLRPPTLT